MILRMRSSSALGAQGRDSIFWGRLFFPDVHFPVTRGGIFVLANGMVAELQGSKSINLNLKYYQSSKELQPQCLVRLLSQKQMWLVDLRSLPGPWTIVNSEVLPRIKLHRMGSSIFTSYQLPH